MHASQVQLTYTRFWCDMDSLASYLKAEYQRRSTFQDLFNSDSVYVETSQAQSHWNMLFRDSLVQFLLEKGVVTDSLTSLESMHNFADKKYFEVQRSDSPANNRTVIQSLMFDFIELQEDLYHNFVIWLYHNVIKKDFYFQKIPTVRIHIPGVTNNLIFPKWHSDSLLGHSPRDINVWFGLTNNSKSDFYVKTLSDSISWLNEYNFDKAKFIQAAENGNELFNESGFNQASEVQDIYNSLFLFDSRCIHTAVHRSKLDWTTKFSIDIRLILTSDFEWVEINNKPIFVGDGLRKAEFRPGSEYGYHERSVEELINER